jgi:hypothetical protein
MLEYLTDLLSQPLGVEYKRELSDEEWLFDRLLSDTHSAETNERIEAAARATGYLEVARCVSSSRRWYEELICYPEQLARFWTPFRDGGDLQYDLLDEICQRRRIVPEDLNYHGLDCSSKYMKDPIDGEKRQAIREVIRLRVSPTSVCEQYSYGLKHRIERVLGYHVSNGEAIEAMILEGYRYERTGGLSCFFKACWIPLAPSGNEWPRMSFEEAMRR